jgi:ferredoxin
MAHGTQKGNYSELVRRLNRHPQGAPPSELLFKILRLLVTESEAGLLAALPLRPFTAKQASRAWRMSRDEARKLLEGLAQRSMLLDIEQNGEMLYSLPPPMTGFFEFSLMRVRHDIDQRALSELYYQYLNVEPDFMRALVARGDTQLGRALVHEPALSAENAVHVLDYERATAIIEDAAQRSVGLCYCRHKMQHLGKACEAPLEICMTFNEIAAALIRNGCGRAVEKEECLALLQTAYDCDLVQFGENVREHVGFICNCCGCCCEAMIAVRRFADFQPVHTTNFIPVIDTESCRGCGRCVTICPVEGMSMVSANDPAAPQRRSAKLNPDLCLGCGLCVRHCPNHSIRLETRPSRILPPLNRIHQTVIMAIERGKLQNLIFDKQVLRSHRALAAVLGAVFKLPPVKQMLAARQLKSRCLEALIRRVPYPGG